MATSSFKPSNVNPQIETHDRELAHEIIEGLHTLSERARTASDEVTGVGLKVSLSSIGSVCETWLKTLQNALHLSYPNSGERFEELAESAIHQPTETAAEGWRPGETMIAED